MPNLITLDHVAAAAERIAPHVVRTPTVPSPGLAEHLGVPVTCKLELLQRTGSFKPRGAVTKLLGDSAAAGDSTAAADPGQGVLAGLIQPAGGGTVSRVRYSYMPVVF